MAVTKADLTSNASTTGAASYATASAYTPTANALVNALVINTRASGVGTPTFTGNGLTWVQVNTQANAAATLRGTLFRAMGASPSNGAGTADFAGANQTGCIILVWEHGGIDTGGTDGSAAVVQSAIATGAAVASLTVTLAAFGSADNGAASGFGALSANAMTPDTGWTEIYDVTYATPDTRGENQWRADNDTTAVATLASGTADMVGIAIEIKAAAVAGGDISARYQTFTPGVLVFSPGQMSIEI